MKIVLTKERFERLINATCVMGQVPSGLLQIEENKIIAANQDPGASHMGYCIFGKNFFKEYVTGEQKLVPILAEYKGILGYGYATDDVITFSIEKDKFNIIGKTERYQDSLMEVGERGINPAEVIPTKAKFEEQEGVGYLPSVKMAPLAQFKVQSKLLQMPKLGEVVKVGTGDDPNNKQIYLGVVSDEKIFNRGLGVSAIRAFTPSTGSKYYIESLTKFASYFPDEVWVTLYEGAIVLSSLLADFAVSFFMTEVVG